MDYIDINRNSWNKKVPYHLDSKMYDLEGFINGNTSLMDIELGLLGDITGKKILHLQCHFGQDSISLSRMGALVTGIDLSDVAIDEARKLAEKTGTSTQFICCNLYDLPNHLIEEFDLVFTSYGTIGWLPDLEKWAKIIAKFLKPNGQFIFVEFHPVLWMFDDKIEKVAYNYFNSGPIIETYSGTYADKNAPLSQEYVMWNHSTSEVLNSLITNGLQILSFDEFDYSPYDILYNGEEIESKKFRTKHLENKIPLVFALKAEKK
jgi:SAM-dependent methyltransferase